VSQVDAVEPVEVAVDSGAATGAAPAGTGSGGAEPWGAGSEGAEPGGATSEGAEPGGAVSGGAELGGTEPVGAEPGGAEPGGAGSARVVSRGTSSQRELLSPQELREWFARHWSRATGAGGTTTAAGSGGARPGCTGAAGSGGAAEATGVGPAGGFAGASGGTGAVGSAGTGASGAAGAAASGGVGAGGSAGTGPSEGAGVGAAGAGTAAGRPGAVPAVSGGTTRPRPYFVPLLEQVLGLPPSPGPAPPLECPPPVQSQSQLQRVSPLPAPSPYTGPTGGLAERRAPASRPASPAHPARTSCRTSRPRPPAVPGTHQMALRSSTAPLRVPLPSPPASSHPVLADPPSDSLRAASPTVARLLATVVTDPSLESAAASALVAELVDFAARCRLDYVASLVADSSEWHDTLRTTLAALGFAPSTADPSLFLRTDTSLPPFYVLVYVDDLVFATADTAGLAHVKSELQTRHTCTDLGELHSYLGLQITRDRAQRTITLTQSHMVQQVLQRFDFTYSSPQATPLSTRHSLSALPSDESVEPSGPYPELVGCLMYLMTCTRPDLAYPLSILARFVAPGRHRPEHMAAAKRVLRYLCSTSGMGLVLGGRRPVVLTGHADASWADDQTTERSSQGYTFSLGSGSVSWRSTRSSSVLSSSCEAEIYAGAMAAQELRWLTYLLTDLGEQPRSPPVLYVDNKAILALCREHRLEHRTKHIALRYFLARELQQHGQLRLAYVAYQANTADIFTKALQPCDHQRFCTMLVRKCVSPSLQEAIQVVPSNVVADIVAGGEAAHVAFDCLLGCKLVAFCIWPGALTQHAIFTVSFRDISSWKAPCGPLACVYAFDRVLNNLDAVVGHNPTTRIAKPIARTLTTLRQDAKCTAEELAFRSRCGIADGHGGDAHLNERLRSHELPAGSHVSGRDALALNTALALANAGEGEQGNPDKEEGSSSDRDEDALVNATQGLGAKNAQEEADEAEGQGRGQDEGDAADDDQRGDLELEGLEELEGEEDNEEDEEEEEEVEEIVTNNAGRAASAVAGAGKSIRGLQAVLSPRHGSATPSTECAGKSPVAGKRKHSELVKMDPAKLATEILRLDEQVKNQKRKLDEIVSAKPGTEHAVVITQSYEELMATVEKALIHVQNTERVTRREAKLAEKDRAENRDMREVTDGTQGKVSDEVAEKEAGKRVAEKDTVKRETGKKAADKETGKKVADKETGKRVADKDTGKGESSRGGKRQKGPVATSVSDLLKMGGAVVVRAAATTRVDAAAGPPPAPSAVEAGKGKDKVEDAPPNTTPTTTANTTAIVPAAGNTAAVADGQPGPSSIAPEFPPSADVKAKNQDRDGCKPPPAALKADHEDDDDSDADDEVELVLKRFMGPSDTSGTSGKRKGCGIRPPPRGGEGMVGEPWLGGGVAGWDITHSRRYHHMFKAYRDFTRPGSTLGNAVAWVAAVGKEAADEEPDVTGDLVGLFAGALACAIAMVWETCNGLDLEGVSDAGYVAVQCAGTPEEKVRGHVSIVTAVFKWARKESARKQAPEVTPKQITEKIETAVVNRLGARLGDPTLVSIGRARGSRCADDLVRLQDRGQGDGDQRSLSCTTRQASVREEEVRVNGVVVVVNCGF
ncbi:unnamed protein product, partial [Closterium sp. NIES-54]